MLSAAWIVLKSKPVYLLLSLTTVNTVWYYSLNIWTKEQTIKVKTGKKIRKKSTTSETMKQDIFPAQTKTKLKSSHNSRAPLSPVCKKRFSRLIPLNRRYSAGKQAFVSEGVSKYKILFIPGLNTCIPIKTVVKPSKPFVFNICIFRHCLGNVEI